MAVLPEALAAPCGHGAKADQPAVAALPLPPCRCQSHPSSPRNPREGPRSTPRLANAPSCEAQQLLSWPHGAASGSSPQHTASNPPWQLL